MMLGISEILAGAAFGAAHPAEYNQRHWCGTACCVLGHARRLAGEDQPNTGPREGELDLPGARGRMIESMLMWTHDDTAALISHVGEDGVLVVPAGGIGAFGEGATVVARALVGEGAAR